MANIECSGKISSKVLEIMNDAKTIKWTIKVENDGSLLFKI